ncbi:MAG: 30S ribosomal protein S7 [Candidatus Hodarchaeales archaeon]
MKERNIMVDSSKILLFNKWDCSDIEIKDDGLSRYINFHPSLLPHSGGRHEHKRFHKSYLHVVERFVNKLMAPGRNCGKKLKILLAMEKAFSLIELRTGENPVQVLVTALVNAAPREETTRISYGGIVFHSAVDSAPQRRIDIGLKLLAQSVKNESFNSIKVIEELIAESIILASTNDSRSFAVKKKQDIERMALSAR